MERLEREDPEKYNLIKETDSFLENNGKLMVRYIFQRIAPTLCDSEPLVFVQKAIKNSENNDFDDLCMFLQIAGFRWSLVEKSYKKSKGSRPGREKNKLKNLSKNKYLIPIFEEMRNGNDKFINGYENILVPWLIENWGKLDQYLKDIKHEKEIYKNNINKIIDKYNSDKVEEVKKLIRESQGIQEYYRNKYNNWIEGQKEEKIFFQSAKQSFLLSELEETIWKILPPWNIKLGKLRSCFNSTQDSIDIERLKQLIRETLSDPQKFREILMNESPLPRATIVDNEENYNPLSDNMIPLRAVQKIHHYEEVWFNYCDYLKKNDKEKAEKIAWVVQILEKTPGMEMVLYMVKRIAPTLCDDKPFQFLDFALYFALDCHEYTFLCEFMQIASFRWSRIENKIYNYSNTRLLRLAHKWIYSEEGQCIAPIFNEMRKESNNIYDVLFFDERFKQVVIPKLIENKVILFDNLNKIAQNHSELKEVTKKIEMSDLSKDFETVKETLNNIEPLKRHYRNEYKGFFNNIPDNDCYFNDETDDIVFFKSINRYYVLSDLEKTYWKNLLEPWHIQDKTSCSAVCVYKELINILEESITLSNY